MKQPKLSPVPGKDQYILLKDDLFNYGDIQMCVPKYFIYNGASIPKIAQLFLYTPFHPDVMGPALYHDWLYLNHQVSRGMADQIFYDMLILNGANKTKARIMHQTLILFGGPSWYNSEEDKRKLMLLYSLIKTRDNFDKYHFPEDVIFS